MNRLEELRKSLLSMTHEEKLQHIMDVREDRKISKHAITVRVARKKTQEKKLTDRFAAMSKEDRAEFIKLMGDAK